MHKRLIQGAIVVALIHSGVAVAVTPFEDGQITPGAAQSSEKPASGRAVTVQSNGPALVLNSDKKSTATALPVFEFKAATFPGSYDASRDRSSDYNVPAILKGIPGIWKTYGSLFKKVGAELGVDPYALAASCIFESYNSRTHTFNPRMKDFAPKANMYAAGIAATQAQDVKGTKVPGLNVSFPQDIQGTAKLLWANPEYGIRCLAKEFKEAYQKTGDLAKAFPKVALPGWKPKAKAGAYGTQAQYVSRAYAFYKAFRAADGR